MRNQDFEIRFKTDSRVEQIEQACLYLFGIFAALDVDLIHDEHPLHSNTISNFAQTGKAFVDSIYANISEITEPEKAEPSIEDLAKSISYVMRHPHLPVDLWNDMMQSINTIHSDADKDLINELETSPEMLQKIFEAQEVKYKDNES